MSNTVCIVAILKDEQPFLDEWVIYHQMIGIDHFFLYDDDITLPLKTFMKPHLNYCTIIPWGNMTKGVRQGNQVTAYNHALEIGVKNFDWVIFLDGDEFISIDKGNVKKFLLQFNNVAAVSLKWRIFGHNGLYDRPTRLISSTLNRRMFADSEEVKTFSKTSLINTISYPHYCELKDGTRVLSVEYLAETAEKTDTLNAHINHYQCRSFQTWMDRVGRGDVNFAKENSPEQHMWRLNADECLREFVTNIAFNKNEYIDNSMEGFKYAIQEKVAQLGKVPQFLEAINKTELIPKVKQALDVAFKFILDHAEQIKGHGLYNGRSGFALLLFTYGRFTNEKKYETTGLQIIDEVAEMLAQERSVDYADGLPGFGVLVEFLVQQGSIKTDTNEALSDIDEFLHYYLITNSSSLNIEMQNGLPALGKYFCARLANPINDYYHTRESINKQVLSEIITLLETPFNTYNDLLSVIDFLSDCYDLVQDQSLVIHYLSYAIDKLETMTFEDKHFAISSDLNYLKATVLLLNAYKKTKIVSAERLAHAFLNTHLNEINFMTCKREDEEFSYSKAIHYLQLYNYTGAKIWEDHFLTYLGKVVYDINSLQRGKEEYTNFSLSGGLIGMAMILLSSVIANGPEWNKVLPTSL